MAVDPVEIQRIADNRHFKALIKGLKDKAAKYVLNQNTTPEERERHLADYHAVERLEAKIRAVASQNGAEDA